MDRARKQYIWAEIEPSLLIVFLHSADFRLKIFCCYLGRESVFVAVYLYFLLFHLLLRGKMKTIMASKRAGSQTVLITGVSKGLGRALALEMAKRGHAIIGCSRSQDGLNSLQAQISAAFSPDSNIPDRHLLMNVDVVSLSLTLSVCCSSLSFISSFWNNCRFFLMKCVELGISYSLLIC